MSMAGEGAWTREGAEAPELLPQPCAPRRSPPVWALFTQVPVMDLLYICCLIPSSSTL